MNSFTKLFYIIVFSTLFFSCSSSSKKEKELTLEELLIKNWKLYQVTGKNNKYRTDSNILYDDKYLEFRKDKTYNTNAPKYFKKEHGVWNINATRDSIYLNKNTDKQIILSIFGVYRTGLFLLSYEVESEQDLQGQLYSLQFR